MKDIDLNLVSEDNKLRNPYGIDCAGRDSLTLWVGVETTMLIPPTSSSTMQTEPGVRNRLGIASTGGDFYHYMNGGYLDRAWRAWYQSSLLP